MSPARAPRRSSEVALVALPLAAALATSLASGCAWMRPALLGDASASLGTTNSGWLHHGAELPDRAPSLARGRPGESTRFGTARLVAALARAAVEVERAFPGGRPLRVGDLGAPRGGRHPRHRSHRAGRDVDVLFYLTDAFGWPTEPRGRVAFSRHGVALDGTSGELVMLDEARTWHFVRTLLTDASIDVQWVFVSRGVKTRLLRHALTNEPDANVLVRAAYTLAQPSNAPPHDDHMHVRIFCSAEERALGCRDTAPSWPWRRSLEVVDDGGESFDDARLLELLDAPFEAPSGPR